MVDSKELTAEEHKARHVELHRAFDELLADYITHARGSVLDHPIRDLVKWSYEQTINPTPVQ